MIVRGSAKGAVLIWLADATMQEHSGTDEPDSARCTRKNGLRARGTSFFDTTLLQNRTENRAEQNRTAFEPVPSGFVTSTRDVDSHVRPCGRHDGGCHGRQRAPAPLSSAGEKRK